VSGEFDSNAQKTPANQALIRLGAGQAQHALDQLGKRWPCTVSKVVSSGIVEVNFEVNFGSSENVASGPVKIEVPVAYPEYIRYPIQVGDKGFCGAADLRLGQMTGQGGGTPLVLDRPGNLTPLMFYWLGNVNWSTDNIDPDALNLYASQDDCVVQVAASGVVVTGDNANLYAGNNLGAGNGVSTSIATGGGQVETILNGIVVDVS